MNNTFIIIQSNGDMELLDRFPRWDRHDGERRFIATINGGDSREILADEDADWIDGSS